MTKDDIQLLYEYDRWANNQILQALSDISPEQFTRDLAGSCRSVRDAFVHIIAGEWIWITYWKEVPRSSEFVTALEKRRDALFNPSSFPNLAAVRSKWADVEKQQVAFVGSVTDESLGKTLLFRTTQVKLAHLMQHVVNHSSYHRGQIASMIRQLGAKPVATDFHVFLVERTPRNPPDEQS